MRGGGGSVMWVCADLGCKARVGSISYIRSSCSVWVSSLLSVLHWCLSLESVSYGLCMLPILSSCGNPCAQSVFPIVCACMSSILGLRSASLALCVVVRCRHPIPSGICSLSLGTVFFHCWLILVVLIWSLVCHLYSLFIWLVLCRLIAGSTPSSSVHVWVVRSALGWWLGGMTASMGGKVYGLSGISKASKILLGDIMCSSFRWLFFVNSE